MTDTLIPKSPDIEKELHPLPRMGSGYSKYGHAEDNGLTENFLRVEDLPKVQRGSEMAPEKKEISHED